MLSRHTDTTVHAHRRCAAACGALFSVKPSSFRWTFLQWQRDILWREGKELQSMKECKHVCRQKNTGCRCGRPVRPLKRPEASDPAKPSAAVGGAPPRLRSQIGDVKYSHAVSTCYAASVHSSTSLVKAQARHLHLLHLSRPLASKDTELAVEHAA